jgi:hypothetical protein
MSDAYRPDRIDCARRQRLGGELGPKRRYGRTGHHAVVVLARSALRRVLALLHAGAVIHTGHRIGMVRRRTRGMGPRGLGRGTGHHAERREKHRQDRHNAHQTRHRHGAQISERPAGCNQATRHDPSTRPQSPRIGQSDRSSRWRLAGGCSSDRRISSSCRDRSGRRWTAGLAERVGFEPTVPVKAQRFSRPSQSTTLAPLRSASAAAPGAGGGSTGAGL